MAGVWRRDVELPSISRQSLPAMLFPASTPEPAAPSWPGWLLCAGGVGAGVGAAAGASAHSGMGGSSPAPLSSQLWLSQPPPPVRAMGGVPEGGSAGEVTRFPSPTLLVSG